MIADYITLDTGVDCMAFSGQRRGNDTRREMALVEGLKGFLGSYDSDYYTLRYPTTYARKLRRIVGAQVRDGFLER